MCWYKCYLSVFEKSPDEAPNEIFLEIRDNISKLQNEHPVASIIVIAYNEEQRLLGCLWSLSRIKCSYPIEIIGVNNNSVDRTAEIYERAGVRYYNEEKKSPGHARNRGLIEAKGKYILCVDADTLYPETYAQTMIEELEKPGTAAIFATWSFIPDKKYPRYKMAGYEFLRNLHLSMLSVNSPERAVRGLTFAHLAEPAKKIGYRTNIRRGEDGAMAYELKNYGKVKFVKSKRARVITSTATLKMDGSISKALFVRLIQAVQGIRKYFVKTKGKLDDQPSNLIDKK
ncbi:MAG: glycosyltransferase family A protein [Bacteroidales bacterium]|nr:glycosyltransferase family A protein [Bacteroidales bacterium]